MLSGQCVASLRLKQPAQSLALRVPSSLAAAAAAAATAALPVDVTATALFAALEDGSIVAITAWPSRVR